ncbi:MAG TPA: DinB family protein [Gemmatimonadaceae bacterium]|nr:DinB family protein [Gemmatimonadaceae bacterium]
MSMQYAYTAIPDKQIPVAAAPVFQHLMTTYASETNKAVSVWREFSADDLSFRPHPRASTVGDILKHQLLSERRFFAEFLGVPEPPAAEAVPAEHTVPAYCERLRTRAIARLEFLATQGEPWWLSIVPFFDVERQRIWVFWRRVLHTAHHRTQLSVYLRVMGRAVPAIYGPTADVTWAGADPTNSIQAAERK